MKPLIIIAAILFNTLVLAADLPEYSAAYDPKRNPFVDFKMAMNEAKADQKLILMELGGDWCSWCHVLDNFLHRNRKIKQDLLDVFVVMKVNVSEENWNEEFRSHLPDTIAYPHFFIADSEGHVIASQDVADLVDGIVDENTYSRRLFKKFIEVWSEANQAIQKLKAPA